MSEQESWFEHMNEYLEEQVLHYIKDLFFVWDLQERRVAFLSKDVPTDPDSYLSNLLDPVDRAKFQFLLKALSAENAEQDFDFAGMDGRWYNLKTYPIKGEPGEVLKIACQLTDVSRLKNRCEATEKLANHYRTVMRAMAHDIKNPVNVMSTGAQLAEVSLSRQEYEEVRGILTMIQGSGKKTFQLIQTMYDLIELWSPEMEVKVQQIDLAEFLDARVAAERQAFLEKQIKVDMDVPPGTQWPLDPVKMRIAFHNLLVNARQFTPEHGTVGIQVFEEGGTLMIQLSDTGIGIPADLRDKIFDPFTEARRAATNGSSGTGVGLAIAKKIIELHNGVLSVSSDGNGSTFTVQLKKTSK